MRRAFFVLLILATTAVPTPALAQEIGEPVVFQPMPETTMAIEGRGAFRGTLEARREGGALTIVNELDLDSYVMGVREVPGMWPMQALKAQAVAARTYVLWEIANGYWQQFGFDVCGTTSCQVYQGVEAELGERGQRWTQAVRETSGEVLLHEGRPALTRYHSTSGGHTLNNEVVYPSNGPRPYLQGIDDPFDEVSPLHRWDIAFSRSDLEAILREGIGLGGTLDEVIADEQARTVTIRTLGGSLEMSSVRFRRVVSDVAPRLFGDRYPGQRSDGESFPATIPSSRFTVERTEDGFIVHGRGWGHGVGMSQWGAKGRADAGHTYEQILAAYYGGLEPQAWTGDTQIRVGVFRGIQDARITANGDFAVNVSADPLVPSTFGTWGVTASGERSVLLEPPEGYDLPVALTGVRAPERLVIDDTTRSIEVGYVVPKAVEITATVVREGEPVADAQMIAEAGERTLRIPLDPGELEGSGVYTIELTAFDGVETVGASVQTTLEIPGMSLLTKVVWALLGIVLLLAIVLWWRRRNRRRLNRDEIAEAPTTSTAQALPRSRL